MKPPLQRLQFRRRRQNPSLPARAFRNAEFVILRFDAAEFLDAEFQSRREFLDAAAGARFATE